MIEDIVKQLMAAEKPLDFLRVPLTELPKSGWFDETGKFTYTKDQIHQLKVREGERFAKNETDFEFIFNRERLEKPDGDEIEFASVLLEVIKENRKIHIESKKPLDRNLVFLTSSKKIIFWLTNQNAGPGFFSKEASASVPLEIKFHNREIALFYGLLETYKEKDSNGCCAITKYNAQAIALSFGMNGMNAGKTLLGYVDDGKSQGRCKIEKEFPGSAKRNTEKIESWNKVLRHISKNYSQSFVVKVQKEEFQPLKTAYDDSRVSKRKVVT